MPAGAAGSWRTCTSRAPKRTTQASPGGRSNDNPPMRLRSAPLAIAVLCLSACGGSPAATDSTDPTVAQKPLVEVPAQPRGRLDKAALAAALDANCAYGNERIHRLGVQGTTPPGAVAMYSGTVPVLEAVQDLQRHLRPVHGLASDWRAYLKASLGVIDAERRLSDRAAAIAGRGEAGLPPAFFAPLQKASRETYGPADALGLKVCTFTPRARSSGAGSREVARAAAAYLAASGGRGKIVGTQSYGPVGVAEVENRQ